MSLKIVKTVDRELTEKEIKSIERFRSYTDGTPFACIGDRVMILLPDEPSNDVAALTESAEEKMRAALSVHPDFSAYNMNDGYVMIFMNPAIFGISEDVCVEKNIGVHLCLQGECLEKCENGEVIAIVYDE